MKETYAFIQAILPYTDEMGIGPSGHRPKYEKSRQEWYYQEFKRLKTIEYAPGSVPNTFSGSMPEQLRLVE